MTMAEFSQSNGSRMPSFDRAIPCQFRSEMPTCNIKQVPTGKCFVNNRRNHNKRLNNSFYAHSSVRRCVKLTFSCQYFPCTLCLPFSSISHLERRQFANKCERLWDILTFQVIYDSWIWNEWDHFITGTSYGSKVSGGFYWTTFAPISSFI